VVPIVAYLKLLKEMSMYHDPADSQNTGMGRGTNDQSSFDAVSNHVIEAISLTSARNWAWAHHSDSYDWMDWHSPFPETTPSE
jgi:hypothetical protein